MREMLEENIKVAEGEVALASDFMRDLHRIERMFGPGGSSYAYVSKQKAVAEARLKCAQALLDAHIQEEKTEYVGDGDATTFDGTTGERL